MDAPAVVRSGVVGPKMGATRFTTLQRCAGHQSGSGEHVLKFPTFGAVERLIEYVLTPERDLFQGCGDFVGGALDAYVAKHQTTERVADVRQVERGLVGRA